MPATFFYFSTLTMRKECTSSRQLTVLLVVETEPPKGMSNIVWMRTVSFEASTDNCSPLNFGWLYNVNL